MALWAYGALAAYQLYSANEQAEAIRENAEEQRRINALAAEQFEVDAVEAERYGFTDAARYETRISKTIGEQKVGYAAQNVDVSVGTAAQATQESKLVGELNKMDLIRQGRERARGLRRKAANLRLGMNAEVAQAGINARSTERSGLFSALSTGLTGYERNKIPKKGSNSTAFRVGDLDADSEE